MPTLPTTPRTPASKPALAPRAAPQAAVPARSVRDGARRIAPGLVVAAAVSALALGLAQLLPSASPLLLAIVLGAGLANLGAVSDRVVPRLEAGLAVAARRLLRIGVALLGLQLALTDVLDLGWGVIAVVVTVVVLGITGTVVAGRLLGLSRTQTLLVAGGFSICGAAAAAAVDGVIDADDEELLTAVALVVLFGTAMIPLLPLLAGALGLDATQAGMWAGASIHEVAQVVAASGVIGGGALTVAVVVKLGRVLLLAPVLAAISVHERRVARRQLAPQGGPQGGAGVDRRQPPLVPLFVAGFLALVLVRTTGVVPQGVLTAARLSETALLTMAMFALGTGVHVAALRRVGARPFVLAGLATAWVSALALGGILLAT